MEENDSLEAKVSTPGNNANFGTYYRGEIDEDVYHSAILVRIEKTEGNYQGKTYPAWLWVYELLGDEYEVEGDDGGFKRCEVREKTSQKLTGAPRKSRAYERYSQLTGGEPEPGDNINLKNLFETQCKIMVKNVSAGKEDNDGNAIIYHNIEKVSIKGIKVKKEKSEDKEEEEQPKSKKKDKEVKDKTVDKEKGDDKEEDEFLDIF